MGLLLITCVFTVRSLSMFSSAFANSFSDNFPNNRFSLECHSVWIIEFGQWFALIFSVLIGVPVCHFFLMSILNTCDWHAACFRFSNYVWKLRMSVILIWCLINPTGLFHKSDAPAIWSRFTPLDVKFAGFSVPGTWCHCGLVLYRIAATLFQTKGLQSPGWPFIHRSTANLLVHIKVGASLSSKDMRLSFLTPVI